MKKRTSRIEKVAAEPWEVERLHREFPVKSREELGRTLANCKGQTGKGQEKEKLTRCVQRKLSQ
jgi:hypothetical protein